MQYWIGDRGIECLPPSTLMGMEEQSDEILSVINVTSGLHTNKSKCSLFLILGSIENEHVHPLALISCI